jgi:hypothetical protein
LNAIASRMLSSMWSTFGTPVAVGQFRGAEYLVAPPFKGHADAPDRDTCRRCANTPASEMLIARV